VRAVLTVLALLSCSSVACEGRHQPRATAQSSPEQGADERARGTLVEIDLRGGVFESTASDGWFPRPANTTFVGLVRALERVVRDPEKKGVFLRLGTTPLEFARAEELGRLLTRIDASKPVVCHAHSLTPGSLWLALRGCRETWLSRAGDVDAVALSAQSLYLKRLLDRFSIQADFIAVGRYKSAAEPLLRDGPSEESRAELLEVLQGIRGSMLEDLSGEKPEVLGSLEQGPFAALTAQKLGLVDQLGDEKQARRSAKRLARAKETQVEFGEGAARVAGLELAEWLRLLSGVDTDAQGLPHVAVLPAIGGITMGSSGLFGSEGIAYQSFAKTIDRLRDDSQVRAVVLRVDSPGGSALASDLLWERLRELAETKPLICSIGSMAASGGYYLASAARQIFASRTSIVGSIGVVGGKIVLGPALFEQGITTVSLSPAADPATERRAAWASPLVAWDDATRNQLLATMTEIYGLFVERVATGRGVEVSAILPHAEGRIFDGLMAKERGLVDEIGGLDEALRAAFRLGGLPEASPITVEGPAEGLMEALGLSADASAEDLARAVERAHARSFQPLKLAPRALVPTLVALSPLLGSERILAVPAQPIVLDKLEL